MYKFVTLIDPDTWGYQFIILCIIIYILFRKLIRCIYVLYKFFKTIVQNYTMIIYVLYLISNQLNSRDMFVASTATVDSRNTIQKKLYTSARLDKALKKYLNTRYIHFVRKI